MTVCGAPDILRVCDIVRGGGRCGRPAGIWRNHMSSQLQEQRQVKLDRLREMGIDPYGGRFPEAMAARQIVES